jgi:uncharacterized protein (DUF1697 family)
MARFVALLRGINVGGKNIIKMEKLKARFESFGYKNVKTFIQSGNVLFDSNAIAFSQSKRKLKKVCWRNTKTILK